MLERSDTHHQKLTDALLVVRAELEIYSVEQTAIQGSSLSSFYDELNVQKSGLQKPVNQTLPNEAELYL